MTPDQEALAKLCAASRDVWHAFLAYGPVDDGRPEGKAFDRAIESLMDAESAANLQLGLKRSRKQK